MLALAQCQSPRGRRKLLYKTDLTATELKQWLEWAGSILLSMDIKSPFPAEPGAAWPSFTADATMAYGYTGERLRAPRPTSDQISLMDELLLLPPKHPTPQVRRIIQARLLVTPLGRRHIFSFNKIAQLLGTSPQNIYQQHRRGLDVLVPLLTQDKIDALRKSLQRHTL